MCSRWTWNRICYPVGGVTSECNESEPRKATLGVILQESAFILENVLSTLLSLETLLQMSFFARAADVAQRGVVLGLLSVFGFQLYQLGANVYSGRVDSPYMHSTYFDDVKKKVEEEYTKDNLIDKRDWYQAEDDSYLKNQVRQKGSFADSMLGNVLLQDEMHISTTFSDLFHYQSRFVQISPSRTSRSKRSNNPSSCTVTHIMRRRKQSQRTSITQLIRLFHVFV